MNIFDRLEAHHDDLKIQRYRAKLHYAEVNRQAHQEARNGQISGHTRYELDRADLRHGCYTNIWMYMIITLPVLYMMMTSMHLHGIDLILGMIVGSAVMLFFFFEIAQITVDSMDHDNGFGNNHNENN